MVLFAGTAFHLFIFYSDVAAPGVELKSDRSGKLHWNFIVGGIFPPEICSVNMKDLHAWCSEKYPV